MNRLWDRLARWCLRTHQDVDGRGNIYYGTSAAAWHWLTQGDPVLGGTYWVGRNHSGRTVSGYFWHRIAPGTNPDQYRRQLINETRRRFRNE